MNLLLIGSTGLVGRAVLKQALADPRVSRVVALTRRPLPPHPKLQNSIIDFNALDVSAPYWRAGAVICTLGTTIRVAGSKPAFRKVDYEYPMAVARLARQAGTGAFVLNSSLGADAKARAFYLRVKGEVEDALANVGFFSVTFVRPSILSGSRSEFRLGERVALAVMGLLGPFLPRRYRAVAADRVATALIMAALAAPPGVHRVESEQIARHVG